MSAADDRAAAAGHIRFAPDVVIRKVGDEAIALKLSMESVYSLNDTAARVALLIADGTSISAITEQLASEYGQPAAVIAVHIDALIADFIAKGLVAPDAQGTT